MEMEEIMSADQQAKKEHIRKLQREKDTVILAHYYVDGSVQEIADFVGDSYFLARKAVDIPQKNILFCGVSFMAESAKILNPDKKVIMADETADCPMAHMADAAKIREVRQKYEDAAVVCYVNSTAEIKAESDVCVTSSNAVRVVRALTNQRIFFIPDNNLGRHVAEQVPEKTFIFHDGFCHVHTDISAQDVEKAKEIHPDALVLSHPECTADVLALSDFIGSTSEIIDFTCASDQDEFIICTETGVFYELQQKNPQKKFYSAARSQICPNMKKITLDKVERALEEMAPEMVVEDELARSASRPLVRMLELAK